MSTKKKATGKAVSKQAQPRRAGSLMLAPSERLILNIVRRHGSIARAAIVAETDLAQQSVHRLVEQLIERGLLRAGAVVRNGRGQPSPRIELVREAAYTVGISINTDSITLCLADLGCNLLEEVCIRTPPTHRKASLAAINDALERILARNGVARERLIGVGVAIAGFFVAGRSQVNAAEPLQDWSLVDLVPILEEAFHLPVWLENNATTAAIGESLLGAGLWAQNFAYLAFNYGFGAGVVLNGKPLFGTHGNAGELTLFTSEEAGHRPTLRSLMDELRMHGVHVDSVEDLRQRFDPTWPGVELWIQSTLPALNRTVNALAGLFDPEAIVFGGQLPLALGRMLIDRVRFLDIHRYGVGPDRPKLVLAETNGDASAIGAALVPLKERLFE
ncbi:ROK family transcriptional regulator [Dyella nitratireducens]|uniref:NagC family transcriptional regulator n=1 Tax=Dyella nitratireducens TaxID=1849580 RepID=A0ABQ1GA08_9GAMM|nr:ROK family transcriptional regulator [Dyella nitratireducens]GGA39652.1 NagC family transcriptional regulator [Dyella nitratireducens]GLQ40468.1 NagC family transcriptional regulator [Dyella nitratireducens]